MSAKNKFTQAIAYLDTLYLHPRDMADGKTTLDKMNKHNVVLDMAILQLKTMPQNNEEDIEINTAVGKRVADLLGRNRTISGLLKLPKGFGPLNVAQLGLLVRQVVANELQKLVEDGDLNK